MRITYITAGAAGTVCGNCLRDNALAAALKRGGHDVVLLPAYTPLLTDEQDVSARQVVFSGINLYLQSKYSFFRSSSVLDGLLDHPRVLRWVSSFAVNTDPAELGEMTRDTFLGDAGPYRRETEKVVKLLRELRPDIVHLTNSMLASLAGPIKRQLAVPVVCSIQGEADFLAGLPEPHRTECYGLLRRHAADVNHWLAPCDDQVQTMAPILGEVAERVETILPGIALEGFRNRDAQPDDGFVVGFLARISEEKGLDVLAKAVHRLASQHPERRVQLRVAGWRAASKQGYVDALRERFGFEDCGYLSREAKMGFLAGLDAFSVPTTYRASKGLYVLEALAAGVPVVQPRIGVFPELVGVTGGGLTCTAGDSQDLAAKLGQLLTDTDRAKQLGLAGQRVVRADFSADRKAVETLAVYERLAG